MSSRAPLALAVLFTGCQPGATDCAAVVTDEARTVVSVSWRTGSPGRSYVEYGVDGRYDQRTPTVDDGAEEHEALLLGLPPLTDVSWRAVTERDVGQRTCEGTIRTGGLPTGVPDLWVRTSAPERTSDERWLVGTALGTGSGIFIIDREASIVWYHEGPHDRMWTDVQYADGALVHNIFDAEIREDVGELRSVGFDGEERWSVRTPYAHHMFAQPPSGFAYLSADLRTWQDPELGEEILVVGDAIVTIDPATGATAPIYSTWDWHEVVRRPDGYDEFYPGAYDWTHANALDYYADTDSYLLTLSYAQLIEQIDATTGVPMRSFGLDADYPVERAEDLFFHAHDANWTPEGTLLMLTSDPESGASGAVEYAVDESRRTLRKIWSYGFDGLQAHALGQARRLANGNTLVNYGTGGRVREITPSGDVVWELESGSGTWFGQVMLVNDLYEGK